MKKIFIFVLLCFIGFAVAIMSNQDVNPTSLLIYHDTVRLQPGIILPDKSVRGEFIATENNLAIVRVRLRTYNRMNTTHLTFRLRQKGDNGWPVFNTYALDRVPDRLLYPFGFPPIPGSKGNVYEFELASTDGTSDNAVGVSGGYHGVAAQYVQPLPEFIPEKIVSTVRDPLSALYFSMFIAAACMYLFKKYRLPLFAYMLIAYAYLPVSVHSNAVLFIAATELFVGNAFLIGILLLIQIPITIALGNILAANRLAALVFFSLMAGAIIAIGELRKKLS